MGTLRGRFYTAEPTNYGLQTSPVGDTHSGPAKQLVRRLLSYEVARPLRKLLQPALRSPRNSRTLRQFGSVSRSSLRIADLKDGVSAHVGSYSAIRSRTFCQNS